MKCPLCGAAGCGVGKDHEGVLLLCENPRCPPNARNGRVADLYVEGDEAAKVCPSLFGKEL
jgi:hypothetical protein